MPRRLIWRIGNRTEEPDKNVNSWPRRRRNLGVGELLSSYSSSTIPMLQFSSKSVVISSYDTILFPRLSRKRHLLWTRNLLKIARRLSTIPYEAKDD